MSLDVEKRDIVSTRQDHYQVFLVFEVYEMDMKREIVRTN